VDRRWADGGVDFIGAEPKTGKGWVMVELGLCIPSGEPIFGEFEVPVPGPFLLVAEEDALDDPAWQERLVEATLRLEVRVIGLDPLVRMHLGDESSARDMSPVLGFMRLLAFETKAAVVTTLRS
jgi:RecA-family ATPase